jgi:MOSC domain-containing protein YiiM
MRITSVNVGEPREIETRQGIVLTSIFKSPVEGRVAARGHNLAGDRQSDLTVHGGPSKAIYAYAAEHYRYWAEQLPDNPLTPGSFGENLTADGLSEEIVHIGDRYRVGSAILQVTQPRMPCYKLALRIGRSDIIKRFWKSGLSGVYFTIVEAGDLGSGDEFQLIEEDAGRVTVADVLRLFKGESDDEELFVRAMSAPLHGSWKQEIRERWA